MKSLDLEGGFSVPGEQEPMLDLNPRQHHSEKMERTWDRQGTLGRHREGRTVPPRSDVPYILEEGREGWGQGTFHSSQGAPGATCKFLLHLIPSPLPLS